MIPIGLIINPNSRHFLGHQERIKEIENLALSHGLLSRTTSGKNDIDKAIEEFRKTPVETIAIVGGDGTCQMTLDKLIHACINTPIPSIALLRGGTMNTTATSLKIKGEPLKLLKRFLKRYKEGPSFATAQRNLLNVNGEHGFIFGNGVFYNFLKIYREGSVPTPVKGFALLSKTVTSAILNTKMSRGMFGKFNAVLKIDGREFDPKILSCVTCSTIPYIGFGFNPYPKTLERMNSFHMLAFPDNPRLIVKNVPRFFLGMETDGAEIFQAVTSEVIIETDSPIGYQLDGELKIGPKRIEIRTGPMLRFIIL